MKILNYQLFIEQLNSKIKIYHGVHPTTKYEYIILLEGDQIKGFATNGFVGLNKLKPIVQDPLKNENVHAIGTIWGPNLGTLLYQSFITYFSKIFPSSNESDLAKYSWMKKFKDSTYIKTKIDGLGWYDRYPEEDYLNYIYDIPNSIKKTITILELNELPNEDQIYKQIDDLHKKTCEQLHRERKKLYTIGQSRDRDDILISKRKNPNRAPYSEMVEKI